MGGGGEALAKTSENDGEKGINEGTPWSPPQSNSSLKLRVRIFFHTEEKLGSPK